MKSTTAWPWSVHDRLSELSLTKAQRLTLLVAIRWSDRDGELYPSVSSWSKAAGLTHRGLQRALRQLEEMGLVQRLHVSTGGPAKTSRYRIPILAENPDGDSGFYSQDTTTSTPTQESKNPERRGKKPRPGFGGTTKNGQENTQQQPTAVDVLSQLKLDSLRDHPNATADRLKWIEKETPTKTNPAGWAADCIRKGWPVPNYITLQADAELKKRWLADLAKNPPQQQRLIREYQNLQASGAARQFSTFGDWAWRTHGQAQGTLDSRRSETPEISPQQTFRLPQTMGGKAVELTPAPQRIHRLGLQPV